jgi:hypothetical protein
VSTAESGKSRWSPFLSFQRRNPLLSFIFVCRKAEKLDPLLALPVCATKSTARNHHCAVQNGCLKLILKFFSYGSTYYRIYLMTKAILA